MFEVIGFKRNDFKSKDGTVITGYTIYIAYPVQGKDAEGLAVERQYISDKRLASCNYTPAVGDKVQVGYNRFGKIVSIYKVG